jgi:endonuclease/exonuclease/phosphatase family metal-dependent hydrolase
VAIALVAPAQAMAKHELGVMTRNVYLGADLTPALLAPTLPQFIAANGQILRDVDTNNFPVRAEGLADEILDAKPDLVGLQEVALWRTAPVDFSVLTSGPAASAVKYDFLELLLDELNADKPRDRYRVVVVQQEFDLEAPGDYDGNPATGPFGADINGRLTMRDVILARTGGNVKTSNEDGSNFATNLVVPVAGVPVTVLRGWTQVDARVRGSGRFRFINTHLEAFQPLIRQAQAAELAAPSGPAGTDLPVILLGDLNSDDDTVFGADRLAYETLLAAGFLNRSTDDPLSCCLNSSILLDTEGSPSDFDHQVDHILTNDEAVTLRSSSVSGLSPVNGYWNSDHAGVFSELRIP